MFFVIFIYRKRSREEDNSDFMPISKRINNLSITNENGFGEHETIHIHNGTNAAQYPMAINQYDNQSNHTNHTLNGHSNHHHHLHTSGTPHTNHLAHVTNGLQGHASHHPHHHQHNQVPKSSSIGAVPVSAAPGAITQDRMHLDGAAMNANNDQLECYSPELSANENPHYYNRNKLLYDLHIERQRRTQDMRRMF